VLGRPSGPQREDMRMLEQEQMILNRPIEQPVLKRERIAIADSSEPSPPQHQRSTPVAAVTTPVPSPESR
jgi:hypothetical protein